MDFENGFAKFNRFLHRHFQSNWKQKPQSDENSRAANHLQNEKKNIEIPSQSNGTTMAE